MSEFPPVTVELRAQIADFTAKMAKARGEFKEVAKDGDSQLGFLANAAKEHFGKVATSSEGVISSFAKFGAAGGSIGAGVLAGAGVAAIAVAGVGEMAKQGVEKFGSLGTQVMRFQRATGASAESASALLYTARQLGVDSDSLTRSMARFGKNIAEHPQLLQKWGVAIAHNRNGAVDMMGTLNNAAESVKNHADYTQKDAIAMDLFGKQGTALLPILNQGTAGLREFAQAAKDHGQIMTPEDVKKAHEMELAMGQLHEAISGFEMQLGREVVPTLTKFVHGMTEVVDGVQKFEKSTHALSFAMHISGGWIADLFGKQKKLADTSKDAAMSSEELANSYAEAQQAADDLGAGVIKVRQSIIGLIDAQRGVRDAAKGVIDAEHSQVDASNRVVDAQQRIVDASSRVTDAQQRLTDAQDKLHQILRAGPINWANVRAAQEQVARSANAVADAQDRLANVQQRLNDIANHTGVFAKDQARAQLAVEHQTLSQVRAQETLTKAQQELSKAQQAGDPQKVAEAELALSEAQLGVKDAANSLADAQDNLTSITNEAIPGTQQYKDLHRQLRDAQQGLTDAVIAQGDAETKYRQERKGDPEFARKVADAQRGVADALRSVSDAKASVKDAYAGLISAQNSLADAGARIADAKWNQVKASLALSDAQGKEQKEFGGSLDVLTAYNSQLKALQKQFPTLNLLQLLAPLAGAMVAENGVIANNGRSSFMAGRGGKLPMFADGGVVAGPIGHPQLAVVHGGETIIPVGTSTAAPRFSGGGAATINITVNGIGQTAQQIGEELAEHVRAALLRRGRGLTAVGLN